VCADAVGFNDTAGGVVDVANSMGVIKAVQRAKSVRVVWLLGFTEIGLKMEGFTALALQLNRIIPSVMAMENGAGMKHVRLLFNFFPKESAAGNGVKRSNFLLFLQSKLQVIRTFLAIEFGSVSVAVC
jgi:hypothetical protein